MPYISEKDKCLKVKIIILQPHKLLATSLLLQWIEDVFLGYLEGWENSVRERPGEYTKTQRSMMLLSRETRLGLKITCEINSIGNAYFDVPFIVNR